MIILEGEITTRKTIPVTVKCGHTPGIDHITYLRIPLGQSLEDVADLIRDDVSEEGLAVEITSCDPEHGIRIKKVYAREVPLFG